MSAFLRATRLTAASLQGFVLWFWWYGTVGLPKLRRVSVTSPVVGRSRRQSFVGWKSLSGRKSRHVLCQVSPCSGVRLLVSVLVIGIF